MLAKIKKRKKGHLALFVFVIFIQLLILSFWYSQYATEKQLAKSLQNPYRQNLALVYSNGALKHYFDAENSFLEYVHTYNPDALGDYRNSLNRMAVNLDSLNGLIKDDKHFAQAIESKKAVEQEIARLRISLEKLIRKELHPLTQQPADSFAINRYNYKKVLNSLVYDSIRITDAVIKRGLIKRLGNAIRGKYPVRREELQVFIRMTYGDTRKSGTIEDQMRNIFLSTDKYYTDEFQKLRNTYTSLRGKDQEVMAINKKILSASQEIILFYTQAANESSKRQLEDAMANISSRKNMVAALMLVLSLSTILLMIYTLYAYKHQKRIARAKITAEKNLEFKNRIIGMLSHEMRSPLSIISTLTYKLKISQSSNAQSATINLLNFTSNSLQITVNQILDFFKNENARPVLYNSKVNLKEEVTSILQSLKALTDVKKIDLITAIDDTMENPVWADNGKIHQLFYNIIGNAIKFTNTGNITATCTFTETGGKFRFDVKIKDTGVGIPQEDLTHVFDKYYQSKHYKEQVSFGAGLGLNLCREIVMLYNGEITVNSSLGKGTEIDFFLMLDPADPEAETNQSKLARKLSHKPSTIAIVDDDTMVTTILKKLLSDVNFSVVAFNSEPAIKDYLQSETVDVILTDLQIAHASGIELVKEIKAMKNANAKVPVIALTGDSYMNSMDLKTTKVDEILIKPIDREELYSKLLKVLS